MSPPERQRCSAVERERESVAAARREAAALTAAAEAIEPPVAAGYTIIREIGRGGMGVIYEARQEEPRRAVALKVMRGKGAVDQHRLLLFRQEMETLARLNHPNIAAIYDAGRTADGRHFFAMELVRGWPVIEHVRLSQLPLRAQLRLFCRICDTVHHAHQRGVTHRDLKPSNIVVNGNGDPKVLDFGLARITDPDEAVRPILMEAGKIVGTLPYMSPEQAQGNPDEVDTRTDVYSLGVILYELLTGRLPQEAARLVRGSRSGDDSGDVPPRPSTFRRALRGDLDLITLRALAKDPERRYQSAAALGDDIQRHLSGQPIADPPSAAYVLRKLFSRNMVGIAFVGSLIVLLTAFGVEMNNLRTEVDEAAVRAAERDRAARVGVMLAEQAQRRSADTVERLARLYMQRGNFSAAEPALRECLSIRHALDDEPWRAAETESRLGECLTALGRYDEAEPLLTGSYPIIKKERGRDHEETRAAVERLIALYQAWGKGDCVAEWQGVAHMDQGEFGAAESVFREWLSVNGTSEGGSWRAAHIECLLAGCLTALGRYEEAESLLNRAYSVLQDALGLDHPWTREAARRVGVLYEAAGKPRAHTEWQIGVGSTRPAPVDEGHLPRD